jgi:hypothetical protein
MKSVTRFTAMPGTGLPSASKTTPLTSEAVRSIFGMGRHACARHANVTAIESALPRTV